MSPDTRRPTAALSPPTQTLALLSRLADVLPWPLLLLQPDAVLVYANQAGRDMLARARPLRRDRHGHVGPARLPQRASFQQALARAAKGAAVPLVLPARPRAQAGRVERLPGEGPVLLLVSLAAPAAVAGTWPPAM